jgi:ferrochelatase
VVAMSVNARRRNEPGQAVEQLEGCEVKHCTAVQIGLGEAIHQPSVRRGDRLDTGGGVESLQGERPPRTVTNEPLETRSVLALDPDRRVDGKPAGPLPRAHVRRGGGMEEATPGEPAQDAKLHRAGQTGGRSRPSPTAGAPRTAIRRGAEHRLRMDGPIEVILAAHGEAESSGFVENFRVGHRTLAHAAEVMRLPAPLRAVICLLAAFRKWRAGAPGSVHNARSRAQAEALAAKLEAALGERVEVRVAFASADPSVEGVLAHPPLAGRRVVISMIPSDSRLSCGVVCHALARRGGRGETLMLARLWDDPAFIAVNAEHVRAHIRAHGTTQISGTLSEPVGAPASGQVHRPASGLSPAVAGRTAILLALHGTLVRDAQGREPGFHAGLAEKIRFAQALKAALESRDGDPWRDVVPAYLNHGVGGTWTEPTVRQALAALSARGVERVWVFPCDYLVDGAEITGDLASAMAGGGAPGAPTATGSIRETRLIPPLNASAPFIDFLADRVVRALAEPGGGRGRATPVRGARTGGAAG